MYKRENLTVAEKMEVLKAYDDNNLRHVPQRDAAEFLGVKPTTLHQWLKTRAKLEKHYSQYGGFIRRRRCGKSKVIEDALLVWYHELRQKTKKPITRAMLLKKAEELGVEYGEKFKATDGWLTRWRERNNVHTKAVNYKKIEENKKDEEEWFETIWKDVAITYEPEDIYNIDDTPLYYLTTDGKEKVSILIGCNMSGTDKRQLLIVGDSIDPRCVGICHLPTDYRQQKLVAISGEIYSDYLSKWNEFLKLSGRKIAILLHESPLRPVVLFSNIQLVFLPKRTSTFSQPLDQGIIKIWKCSYKTLLKEREESGYKLTIIDILCKLAESWEKVSVDFIKESFEKCFEQFLSQDDVTERKGSNSGILKKLLKERKSTAQSLGEAPPESESSDDEALCDPGKPITQKQAKKAVEVIRRLMLEQPHGGDFSLVYQLTNFVDKCFLK